MILPKSETISPADPAVPLGTVRPGLYTNGDVLPAIIREPEYCLKSGQGRI